MSNQVSQESVQILASGANTPVRASLAAVEILASPLPALDISQIAVNILYTPNSLIDVSQVAVLLLARTIGRRIHTKYDTGVR